MRKALGIKWLSIVGLLCLFALIYYIANDDKDKAKYQSVLNKGTDVASMVRPRSVGEAQSKVALSGKENASFLDHDHDDGDLIEVGSATGRTPVIVGEYLDPDANPKIDDTARSLHQKNVGMFLDADSKPSVQTSSGVFPQREVGKFIDIEGNGGDSSIVVSNESKGVNIGVFIDPDSSE